MASPEQKNPSDRVQILDADYIPRDQAPNLPASAETGGKGRGLSAVAVVMICAIFMALAAAVSSGELAYGTGKTAALAPMQTAEARYVVPTAAPRNGELPSPANGELPRLGIAVQNVTSVTAEYYNRLQSGSMVPGVQVYALDSDGAGAAAGLRQGDIITALDGQDIRSKEELLRAEDGCRAGEAVELTVYREGEYQSLSAVMERDDSAP